MHAIWGVVPPNWMMSFGVERPRVHHDVLYRNVARKLQCIIYVRGTLHTDVQCDSGARRRVPGAQSGL